MGILKVIIFTRDDAGTGAYHAQEVSRSDSPVPTSHLKPGDAFRFTSDGDRNEVLSVALVGRSFMYRIRYVTEFETRLSRDVFAMDTIYLCPYEPSPTAPALNLWPESTTEG